MGEWQGDKKSGFGTQTWPDGSAYAGQWQDARLLGSVLQGLHGSFWGLQIFKLEKMKKQILQNESKAQFLTSGTYLDRLKIKFHGE